MDWGLLDLTCHHGCQQMIRGPANPSSSKPPEYLEEKLPRSEILLSSYLGLPGL